MVLQGNAAHPPVTVEDTETLMEEQVEVSMEHLLEQLLQKDLGRRLQVGQEITDLILDQVRSPHMEQDQSLLDRMVDAVASSWVNCSNFKVRKNLGWRSTRTSVDQLLASDVRQGEPDPDPQTRANLHV